MAADAWNLRIGAIWAALLSAHSIDRRGLVIEVGPGFTDKVGLGLATWGFTGTLYIVEPNLAACDWVVHRYRQLLGEAVIVPIAEPLPAAVCRLPEGVDGLLMNHVLDDLVRYAALPAADRARDARCAERPAPPEVRTMWRRVLDDRETLRDLGTQVVDDLRQLLRRTTPRMFCASQYDSWYLAGNGLDEVNQLGALLLRDLAGVTGSTSDEDRAALHRHGEDPGRWLVCDFGSTREAR